MARILLGVAIALLGLLIYFISREALRKTTESGKTSRFLIEFLLWALAILAVVTLLGELAALLLLLIILVVSIWAMISLPRSGWCSTLPKGLRHWVLLTGSSFCAIIAAVILHGLFDGLAMITRDWPLIYYPLNALAVGFFLVAIPFGPIVFLFGLVGTLITSLIRQKPPDSN